MYWQTIIGIKHDKTCKNKHPFHRSAAAWDAHGPPSVVTNKLIAEEKEQAVEAEGSSVLLRRNPMEITPL